jgi:hypothetical protein
MTTRTFRSHKEERREAADHRFGLADAGFTQDRNPLGSILHLVEG